MQKKRSIGMSEYAYNIYHMVLIVVVTKELTEQLICQVVFYTGSF